MSNCLHTLPAILAIAVTCGLLAQGTSAHTPSKYSSMSHPQAQKTLRTCYDNRPFDADAEHVPVDFCGVDIPKLALYTYASPLLEDRREFETSDAYKARRALFGSTPLVPGLKPSDRMAFVFRQTPQWNSPVTAAYDADVEKFQVSVHAGLLSVKEEQGSQSYGVLTMKEFQVAEQRYVASNAMGVRVKVDDTSYRVFGIAVRPGRDLYPSDIAMGPTFEVPVPASEARRLKGMIAVIVTGHLRAPWIVADTSASEATISDPYVFRYDKKFLTIEPEELIVFRKDTGAILGRFNEK